MFQCTGYTFIKHHREKMMQQSWKTEKLTGEDMKETSRQLSGIKDVLFIREH